MLLLFSAHIAIAALPKNNSKSYNVVTTEKLTSNSSYANNSFIYIANGKGSTGQLIENSGDIFSSTGTIYDGYTGSGILTVNGTFKNAGNFIEGDLFGSQGSLTVNAASTVNNTSLWLNGDYGSGLINNSGTFNNSGAFFNAEYAKSTGTVTNKTNATWNNGGSFYNGYAGTGALTNAGTFTNTGSLFNGYNGTASIVNSNLFNNQGSFYNGYQDTASFINSGTFTNSASFYNGYKGVATFVNNKNFTNTGSLYNAYANTASFSNTSTLNNTGTLYNGDGATGSIINSGSFTNNGTVYDGYKSSASFTNNNQFVNNSTFNNVHGVFTNNVNSNFLNNNTANFYGGTFNNYGTVNIFGGGFGLVNNQITDFNQNAGLLTLADGHKNYIGFLSLTGGSIKLKTANDTIIVASDYNNQNFGVGNSFNANQNVNGLGRIVAGGNASQGLLINNTTATTANANLNFGNVHVGSFTSEVYQITNYGSSGPEIRGALQTGGGTGGHITDSRLQGTGVTASNYTPVLLGAISAPLVVSFNAVTAGVLTDQQVQVVNNFSAKETLKITGAAYNLAAASIAQTNFTFANERVGDIAIKTVNIANIVTTGQYSEGLAASFSQQTNGIVTQGAISGLVAGTSDKSNLKVAINTTNAGHITGSATIVLNSDGSGTSGLGLTPLTNKTVTVTGNVYRLASAANITDINVPYLHVGQTFNDNLTISNIAANDGYSEKLVASFAQVTGNISNNNGTVNLLAAGSSNNSAMSIGVDTSSEGAKSGSVQINYLSDGLGTSGFAAKSIGSQTINFTTNVYNYASAALQFLSGVGTLSGSGLNYTLNLGNIQQNSGVLNTALALENSGINSAWTDVLSANVTNSVPNGLFTSTAGNFTNLAGGQSNNFQINLNTSQIGSVTDVLLFNIYASDPSGYLFDLGNLRIILNADILASGDNPITAIPEPKQWLMFMMGLLLILYRNSKLAQKSYFCWQFFHRMLFLRQVL